MMALKSCAQRRLPASGNAGNDFYKTGGKKTEQPWNRTKKRKK
jgi:hypothetical protein